MCKEAQEHKGEEEQEQMKKMGKGKWIKAANLKGFPSNSTFSLSLSLSLSLSELGRNISAQEVLNS